MTWRPARPSGIPRAGRSTTRCATRCASSRRERGYQEIYTPPLVHQKLWEQSGHWDHYRDNMFLVEAEEQTFSLKPMNCPESTFIYRSRTRSYRELPLRLSEYGMLHRAELSGVLSGLTRVRHFYRRCPHLPAPEQIGAEILALMGEVTRVLRLVRPDADADLRHATRQGAGRPDVWAGDGGDDARRRSTRSGLRYREKPKDGAFYAPKIDIQIEDALGREWQTATIQVDRVMLPERFDLQYIDEDGEQQRPVAIHRAIYGSLERFIGVIVEHFAGAFPFWCAPVQAVVVPIADRHNEAGQRAGRRPSSARHPGRGRRQLEPDAEQDPPRAGAEGAVHARARRSRGRGTQAAPRTRAGEQQPAETWQALADRLAAEAADRRP